MKLTKQHLIDKIVNAKGWIDANELAQYFNVSTRTVRNYVKNINLTYHSLILSSNKGYCIDENVYSSIIQTDNTEENINLNRIKYVINQLVITKDFVDVYDLADELAISDSHFERLLCSTKSFLSIYNISIERKRNKIWLNGNEKEIRRLISNILSNDDDSFIYTSDLFSNTTEIDVNSIKVDLLEILENLGYYISDYGLNTILLHLIVMLERVKTGNSIDENNHGYEFNTKEKQLINKIKLYIQNKYEVIVNDNDMYSLAIVIINNCANTGDTNIDKNNIELYVSNTYYHLAEEIMSNISTHYGIDKFSTEFIISFSLHIENLVKRAMDNSYTPNPLASTFKGNYPLIYDMATYATKAICDKANIKINDDEISFIAFHIGSYLENKSFNRNKINCCFVYAEYHNFHVKAIDKILQNLENDLFISSNISIKSLDKIPNDVELIISSCPIPKNYQNKRPIITTSMFISNDDINNIRNSITTIKEDKIKQEIVYSLSYFIKKKLFHRNLYFTSEYNAIHYLSNEAYSHGVVDNSFENEVIERENLSSTSFKVGIATPHSLNMNAKHSFLSVVINDKPMKWGNFDVNIIIMLGTSIVDRDAFKLLFDELIAILYEEENIHKLIRCNNYEKFTQELSKMIKSI